MTVITLPAEPRTIPTLTCDPAGIEGFAADLLTASTQVDDLGTFVPGTAPIADWTGDDAVSYHAAIRPLGERADAMSLALRQISRRTSTHAVEMQGFVDSRVELTSRRGSLIGELNGLRLSAPMVPADQVADFQDDCDRLGVQIGVFDEDVATLVEAIAAEESEMVAAFEGLQTLRQVTQRYQGVADPADAALARKPGPGAGPDAVRQWWESLSESEQFAILAASPGSIGNLDGIPAGVRDQANTTALERDLAMLELLESRGQLTGDERDHLNNARATRDAIQRVADRDDPVTGEPVQSQLYIYDPTAFDGDGRVAVVAGDLDTADNIAVITPGLTNDATKIPGNTSSALNLYEAARADDPSQSTAVMAWMGYDAPDDWDSGGVAFESMAENGGERLADTFDGINAIRTDDPHLVAVGHSYGSTTTGTAATDEGLDVGDVVLLGSPGPGDSAEHASDLGVGEDHVWVGSNSRDPVADLGDKGWVNKGNIELGLGRDPAEDDFGANRFEAEAVDRGEGLNPLNDHSKYFDHDSESLDNLAQILNGDYDEVELAEHKYDPWYSGPVDPEWDRTPETESTRGGGQ
ncbi:alpha/beta hydrolase [Nocardioides sp. Bht2]|uniref:alpha/beta hydrolase n=1 Tax=Nocardioides sp. Bht2 TaxID=3392297 RepID=UPI0039B49731